MRNTFDYIIRWLTTKIGVLLSNALVAAAILCLTCIAVRNNAFEEYNATKACLFAVLMCNVWSGIFNTLGVFCSEQEYIVDDLQKFLPVHTYVIGNVLIQLFLCLLEALISTSIFKWFFDYEAEGIFLSSRSLEYLVTFFLVLVSADCLGFMTGLLIKGITSIMTAVPILLVAQLLFSGCLFELDGVLSKVANITTAKWGFNSLGSLADLNNLPLAPMASDAFRAEADYIMYCWSYMVLLAIIFILLSGVVLYFKLNNKQD